jgi:hypothetical protein
VNALNEMIQQVWIGETLYLRSWTEGLYCVQCTKRAINLIGRNIGICSLNKSRIKSAKVLHSHLLPYPNVVVQHYQAGFQSGKSTTEQLFASTNEFNITTHHLFIHHKAAYDTITRKEIYVIMVDLDFSTELIRLIKATLTTFKFCVNIQNGSF